MSNRLRFFAFAAAAWALLITARLAWLQLACHEGYLKRSLHTERVVQYVRRASILDRDGRLLAGSIPTYNLKVALDSKSAAFARADLTEVAGILSLPLAQVEAAAQKKSGFAVLTSRATPEQIQGLRALNLKGLILPQEYERVYPYGSLTEHLLGFTDYSEQGRAGLERAYNGRLQGQPGESIILRDSLRFSYDLGQEIRPPLRGTDLRLALDVPLQYVCTRALQGLEEVCDPEWASATVMDPFTGEIQAHAVWPPFDPHRRGQAADEHLASCPFEPGSILKPVLATAVLRNRLSRPSEYFWCGHGRINLLGRTIEDHAVYDNLTFAETLMFSSNVGCISWGLRLSRDAFMECLRTFGFGRRTGIDLRPESAGLLPPARRVNALAQAYLSIGQGISVTHAQILQAYAALANGGWRVAPHFIQGSARDRCRILDPATQATMRDILFRTVAEGTGKKAQAEGIALAGKTGTAQKADRFGYEKGQYVSSFIGWFPSEEPRHLVFVVVSGPKGMIYGSDVAAPVARHITFFLNLEREPHASV